MHLIKNTLRISKNIFPKMLVIVFYYSRCGYRRVASSSAPDVLLTFSPAQHHYANIFWIASTN